jgi:hypothetical protein
MADSDNQQDQSAPRGAKEGSITMPAKVVGGIIIAGGALAGYYGLITNQAQAPAADPNAGAAQVQVDPNAAAAQANTQNRDGLEAFLNDHSEHITDIRAWYILKDPANPNPVLERYCAETYGAEMKASVVTGMDGTTPYYRVLNTPEISELVSFGNPDRQKACDILGLQDPIELNYMLSDTLAQSGVGNGFTLRDKNDPNQGFYVTRMAEIVPAEKTVPKVRSTREVYFGARDLGEKIELIRQDPNTN